MKETLITEIRIIPLKLTDKGLVAFASCILDDKLFLGGLAIYTVLRGGYRLTYPTRSLNTNPKRIGDNKDMQIYNPINQNFRTELEEAVIQEYQRLTGESNEVNNYDENIHT